MPIDQHSNRILWKTAMLSGAPFTLLRDAIFTHPTMAEGLWQSLADVEVRREESERAGS